MKANGPEIALFLVAAILKLLKTTQKWRTHRMNDRKSTMGAVLSLLTAAVLVTLGLYGPALAAQSMEFTPDQVLVSFHPGTPGHAVAAAHAESLRVELARKDLAAVKRCRRIPTQTLVDWFGLKFEPMLISTWWKHGM